MVKITMLLLLDEVGSKANAPELSVPIRDPHGKRDGRVKIAYIKHLNATSH